MKITIICNIFNNKTMNKYKKKIFSKLNIIECLNIFNKKITCDIFILFI